MNRTINFQELENCLKIGQFEQYKLCFIDDGLLYTFGLGGSVGR